MYPHSGQFNYRNVSRPQSSVQEEHLQQYSLNPNIFDTQINEIYKTFNQPISLASNHYRVNERNLALYKPCEEKGTPMLLLGYNAAPYLIRNAQLTQPTLFFNDDPMNFTRQASCFTQFTHECINEQKKILEEYLKKNKISHYNFYINKFIRLIKLQNDYIAKLINSVALLKSTINNLSSFSDLNDDLLESAKNNIDNIQLNVFRELKIFKEKKENKEINEYEDNINNLVCLAILWRDTIKNYFNFLVEMSHESYATINIVIDCKQIQTEDREIKRIFEVTWEQFNQFLREEKIEMKSNFYAATSALSMSQCPVLGRVPGFKV